MTGGHVAGRGGRVLRGIIVQERRLPSNPITRLALVLVASAAIGSAAAQPKPDHTERRPQQQQQQAPSNEQGVLRLLPADSVTEHGVDTAAGRIAYTATAGTLPFYDQSGDQSAAVFYTAYVAKDRGANRPLTFVFNGGPGAASAFLNLGLVGPRRLDVGPQARDAASAKLVDNPETWLAFTDLVLIDPIGTGWSRTAKPGDEGDFMSVRADAQVLAKTIALYLTHNGRSGSPKYILGESYGGFRAVKVARAAWDEQGVVVNGIIMLSPLMEGSFQFVQHGPELNRSRVDSTTARLEAIGVEQLGGQASQSAPLGLQRLRDLELLVRELPVNSLFHELYVAQDHVDRRLELVRRDRGVLGLQLVELGKLTSHVPEADGQAAELVVTVSPQRQLVVELAIGHGAHSLFQGSNRLADGAGEPERDHRREQEGDHERREGDPLGLLERCLRLEDSILSA